MIKNVGMVALVILSNSVSAQLQKDPTRPANVQERVEQNRSTNASQGLSLDATLVTQTSRVAIINGVAVSEGAKYMGIKIIQVEHNSIIVEQQIDGISQQRTIRVNATGEIKKNATNNF